LQAFPMGRMDGEITWDYPNTNANLNNKEKGE